MAICSFGVRVGLEAQIGKGVMIIDETCRPYPLQGGSVNGIGLARRPTECRIYFAVCLVKRVTEERVVRWILHCAREVSVAFHRSLMTRTGISPLDGRKHLVEV